VKLLEFRVSKENEFPGGNFPEAVSGGAVSGQTDKKISSTKENAPRSTL